MSGLFGNPPRSPERIDQVLAAIRSYWIEHPYLRLGQVLENHNPGAGNGQDLYYVADSFWIDLFAPQSLVEDLSATEGPLTPNRPPEPSDAIVAAEPVKE